MDELCREKHKAIENCLGAHTSRLNNHSERIDNLEKFQSSTAVKIEHLIEQITSLISAIKWGTGLTITTLLAFFIWYIQRMGV